MDWTKEQKQAIEEKGSNILVAAAAGSGKTAVLVERIINKVVNENIDIDKMLIVTFTNAAAAEMRERILDAIYKKIEEEKAICPENSHLEKNLIKILANELKDEEFIKIDFKNFANKSIRQKFLDVDEKDLYDVFYDYDTCFTHGYWSAIRESALLICDNPLHNYHSVPDTNGDQKLIDISSDYVFILNKIIEIEPAIYNEYRTLANIIRNTNKRVYLVVTEENTSKVFRDIIDTYKDDIFVGKNECPICGSSLIIKPTGDKEELECSNEKCSYHRDINEN